MLFDIDLSKNLLIIGFEDQILPINLKENTINNAIYFDIRLNYFAFDARNGIIAAANSQGFIDFYSARKLEKIKHIDIYRDKDKEWSFDALRFSNDGRRLAFHAHGFIYVINTQTNEFEGSSIKAGGSSRLFGFGPDGNHLYFQLDRGIVKMADMKTGIVTDVFRANSAVLQPHSMTVLASAGEGLLVSGQLQRPRTANLLELACSSLTDLDIDTVTAEYNLERLEPICVHLPPLPDFDLPEFSGAHMQQSSAAAAP